MVPPTILFRKSNLGQPSAGIFFERFARLAHFTFQMADFPHDADDSKLPDPLATDLSRLYARPDVRVPADLDRLITNSARAHLAGRGRLRLLLRGGGAAA